NLNHTLRAMLLPEQEEAGSVTLVFFVAWVVSSVTRNGVVAPPVPIRVGKLMLSFVAEEGCATNRGLGSEGVPPGGAEVTAIAREPAVVMSEAGIEAKSCVAFTNVVR